MKEAKGLLNQSMCGFSFVVPGRPDILCDFLYDLYFLL